MWCPFLVSVFIAFMCVRAVSKVYAHHEWPYAPANVCMGVYVCLRQCVLARLCMCGGGRIICFTFVCMRRARMVQPKRMAGGPGHTTRNNRIIYCLQNVSNAEIDLVGWIRITIFVLESVAFDGSKWTDRNELTVACKVKSGLRILEYFLRCVVLCSDFFSAILCP